MATYPSYKWKNCNCAKHLNAPCKTTTCTFKDLVYARCFIPDAAKRVSSRLNFFNNPTSVCNLSARKIFCVTLWMCGFVCCARAHLEIMCNFGAHIRALFVYFFVVAVTKLVLSFSLYNMYIAAARAVQLIWSEWCKKARCTRNRRHPCGCKDGEWIARIFFKLVYWRCLKRILKGSIAEHYAAACHVADSARSPFKMLVAYIANNSE